MDEHRQRVHGAVDSESRSADELNGLFSRFDQPPSGQYSGWYQYFDRDINALLGKNVPSPFHLSYCGKGDLEQCQNDIWDAIETSGDEIAIEQGSTGSRHVAIRARPPSRSSSRRSR